MRAPLNSFTIFRRVIGRIEPAISVHNVMLYVFTVTQAQSGHSMVVEREGGFLNSTEGTFPKVNLLCGVETACNGIAWPVGLKRLAGLAVTRFHHMTVSGGFFVTMFCCQC